MPGSPLESGVVLLRFAAPADRDTYTTLRMGSRASLERWEPIPPPGFDAFGPSDSTVCFATCDTPDCKRLLIIERASGEIAGHRTSTITRGRCSRHTSGTGSRSGRPDAGRHRSLRYVHARGPGGQDFTESSAMSCQRRLPRHRPPRRFPRGGLLTQVPPDRRHLGRPRAVRDDHRGLGPESSMKKPRSVKTRGRGQL
jgi:hypothetical protein